MNIVLYYGAGILGCTLVLYYCAVRAWHTNSVFGEGRKRWSRVSQHRGRSKGKAMYRARCPLLAAVETTEVINDDSAQEVLISRRVPVVKSAVHGGGLFFVVCC